MRTSQPDATSRRRRRRILLWLGATALALLVLTGGIAAFVHVASERQLLKAH